MKFFARTKRKRKKSLPWVWIFLISIFATLAAGALLLSLFFQQLDSAFRAQPEFLPTRVYSDVAVLSPPMTRRQVKGLLEQKNISWTSPDTETMEFLLPKPNYPHQLIPNTDAFWGLTQKWEPANPDGKLLVRLKFQENSDRSPLLEINIAEDVYDRVYLPPELVATLSLSSLHPEAPGLSQKQIRTNLTLAEIPAPIWQALIAVEDQNFLNHPGVDPRGFARAIWVNLKTLSFAQGGSTITQQLVKNLMARRGKNVLQKVNELFLSLLLEWRYSKEQILERYLNEVYLGQVGSFEIHGVAEGAQLFFGKSLEELRLGEVALMVGLIRGPSYYSPYRNWERARGRQQTVLNKMVETGMIASGEAEEAFQTPIQLAPPQTTGSRASFFVDVVKSELIDFVKDELTEQELATRGFQVYTTLDLQMQNAAQNAVTDGIKQIESRFPDQFKLTSHPRLEGILASVEQETGALRALVGGKNYSESNFNRILNMRRQVGSTFKPIVFLAALEKGLNEAGVAFSPAYPLEDGPLTLRYDQNRQTWSPKNYEKSFRGWVSLREALAHSLNVPTARLGTEVGLQKIIETARALGITSPLPSVPSLTLGVAELSPMELLQAYATLAHRCQFKEMSTIRWVTESDQTPFAEFIPKEEIHLEPGSCDLLTELLMTVFSEGTAASAQKIGWDRPAAGKTGTTNSYYDAWFAGYTPELTTVTWVGWDEAIKKENGKVPPLTGANAALPIWVRYMSKVLESLPPSLFPESEHLGLESFDLHSGKVASTDCSPRQVILERVKLTTISRLPPEGRGCEPDFPKPEPRKTLQEP